MWNKKCVFETLNYINKSEEVKNDTKIASIDISRYAEAKSLYELLPKTEGVIKQYCHDGCSE
jgi:hypothetical protein